MVWYLVLFIYLFFCNCLSVGIFVSFRHNTYFFKSDTNSRISVDVPVQLTERVTIIPICICCHGDQRGHSTPWSLILLITVSHCELVMEILILCQLQGLPLCTNWFCGHWILWWISPLTQVLSLNKVSEVGSISVCGWFVHYWFGSSSDWLILVPKDNKHSLVFSSLSWWSWSGFLVHCRKTWLLRWFCTFISSISSWLLKGKIWQSPSWSN